MFFTISSQYGKLEKLQQNHKTWGLLEAILKKKIPVSSLNTSNPSQIMHSKNAICDIT